MNDSIDEFFERERESVPSLAATSARFEEIQTVARRRRNRNTTMVSAAAAVVLAVVGTGAVIGAQNLGGSNTAAQNPAGPTAKVAVTASVTPTVTSSAAQVAPAVPADFTAWSVSFVGNSQGWALGGYSCNGGQQCVAVLETTDGLASWQTVARPALPSLDGMSAGHATIRFQSPLNGWMVGAGGVYSTHDGGQSWAPVAALASAGIDALEAWNGQVYAVGLDGSLLWVSSDPASDAWAAEPGLDLPPASAGTKDSISPEDHALAVVRSTGQTTTVRFSSDGGGVWQTLPSPCPTGAKASARLFVVVDPSTGRFVCGNGQVYGVWFDGSQPAHRDVTFKLRSSTGEPVVAESVAHANNGTVVAYQGAGLQELLVSKTANTPFPGDFSYVGMTNSLRGIALATSATNAYWITINGALTWHQESFG
jgi:hypothetical protein